MKPALFFTALLGCGAVAVSAAEAHSAVKAGNKTASKFLSRDELRAVLAEYNGVGKGPRKVGAKKFWSSKNFNVSTKWTDSAMGLVKKAVMTFAEAESDELVADTYLESLGVTWDNAYEYGLSADIANPPTPDHTVYFDRGTPKPGVDGSMTSTDGLMGVSFYYATPSLEALLSDTWYAEDIALYDGVLTKGSVTAWTGPAGTGKELGTMVLDWTKGDYDLTFKKVDFKFKGVAKSITFSNPKGTGYNWYENIWELYVDNVAIVTPAGKTKVLAAGAVEVEAKLADIEQEVKETMQKIN